MRHFRRNSRMQSKKPPQVPQAAAPFVNYPTARGLRIEAAAVYSGLSPFFIEEEIRNGRLPSIGGPGSGVCAAHIVLRERLDEYLDQLAENALKRAEERHMQKKAAA